MMIKGSTVIKMAGILMGVFGVLNVLWAMGYGFLGAHSLMGTTQTTLPGLMMFYGFYGVLCGIFQIAVASVCIRHAKIRAHWHYSVVWGIITLVLGVINLLALIAMCEMMTKGNPLYPQWYGFAIVGGGIIMPILATLGGYMNGPASTVPEGRETP